MVVVDRYNRQELIEGWDQEKLRKARAVVIGSGNLAQYSAVSLAALGFGNIEIYDPAKLDGEKPKEFLMFQANSGNPKAKALENILRQINPETRIKGVSLGFSNSALMTIVGSPDVIIDTTNSPQSKKTVLDYAAKRKVRVVSVSADRDRAEMYIVNPGEDPSKAMLGDYAGKEQGSAVSCVIGGLLTEELRKITMPLTESDKPVSHLTYNLRAEKRFSDENGTELKPYDLSGKHVLVVGAGALGNFAALGIAMQGVGRLDLMDYDEVDSTNLNRQVLFYDAVGKKKAEALAEKLKQISPNTDVRGIVAKLDERSDYFTENHPDLILDCVDSFAVRAVINYHAVRNQIPLVSGGTNPRSGQVSVYVPGKTSCLDCKLGVEKFLAQERSHAACRYAPDPSVIMTNQVVGGMMTGEAVKVLSDCYGEPASRILKYDSTISVRGGLVGSSESCSCSKPDVNQWLAEVDRKV
jgi:molybdopterin/thiamine biosynthesis adenylyltransferase